VHSRLQVIWLDTRVHTGERNHKCPFPGCETRCSRQDNLQQHYRIHLSPGSRRASSRTALARTPKANPSSAIKRRRDSVPVCSTPPLDSPPALEQARLYDYRHSSPPDSPPALVQATLPAAAAFFPDPSPTSIATAALANSGVANRAGPSTSPDIAYSSLAVAIPQSLNQGSYRSGPSPYQNQERDIESFSYAHSSTSVSLSPANSFTSTSYSSSHSHSQSQSYNSHQPTLPQIDTSSHLVHQYRPQQVRQQSISPPSSTTSIGSRHSISHISHPQPSYPHQNIPYNAPSPASSQSSHHSSSGYSNSYADGGYHTQLHEQQPVPAYTAQGQFVHSPDSAYSPPHIPQIINARYHNVSPPPQLARLPSLRGLAYPSQHQTPKPSSLSSYAHLHHPQPQVVPPPYHYQYTSWKQGQGSMRPAKVLGVGAVV